MTQKKQIFKKTFHWNLVSDIMRYTEIKNKRVLVIGCNTGLECEIFRLYGAKKVVGVDIIETIGHDYKKKTIKYVRTSAKDLPFKSASFDVCSSFASLEHISEPEKIIKNMIRVTDKDGIIYCQAAPLWNSPFGHHKDSIFPNDPWIHLRKKNKEEMKLYYKNICNEIVDGCSIENHIDYIYSKHFNRVSAKEYRNIIASILDDYIFRSILPIHIKIEANNKCKQLLTSNIKKELNQYSEDELCTIELYIVLKKI